MKNLHTPGHIKIIFLLACLMTVVFSLFCTCSTPTQPTNSGIKGIVMLGPISPVEKEGEINEKPYPDAVVFVMNSSGTKKIAEFKSDQNGRFQLNLAPGTYSLVPQTPKKQPFPIGKSETVVVSENQYTEITINYDSGIR